MAISLEGQKGDKEEGKEREDLRIDLLKTLGSLYQEMRCDRGIIMLSEEAIRKEEFKNIRPMLEKAYSKRKVQQFFQLDGHI